MVDEIRLGSLSFTYERPGVTVAKVSPGGDEEAIGYCEIVTPEEWQEFTEAAALGATVVSAMTPEPFRGRGGVWESAAAREEVALKRHEQTLQMLGAVQFQLTVLTLSLGAGLAHPEAHETIRKDLADLVAQAEECRKFISRLLYVRAGEDRR